MLKSNAQCDSITRNFKAVALGGACSSPLLTYQVEYM